MNKHTTKYIIDYDSTFIKVESLDILANISMDNLKNKQEILDKISYITNQAMSGEITFTDALKQRMALLKANKQDITLCVGELKKQVSDSFLTDKNKEFLLKNSDNIYIVSNGMKDLIKQVVCEYGIKSKNIFANNFVFGGDGGNEVCGVDESNILTKDSGKINTIKALGFNSSCYVVVIGDGITDYSIKKAGYANKFYAYCENIKREAVCKKADKVAYSLDDVLDDTINI